VIIGDYFRLNYHKLLMVINGYFKLNYHKLLIVISVIILLVIGGYFINGYCWLSY